MPLVAPVSADFEVSLDAIAAGPARIRVAVWANSEAAQDPDHHLLIQINGNPAVDAQWDGKGWHVIEGEFGTELLKDGVNEVRIEAPGDTGAAIDLVQLDWIELEYSRLPRARDGMLIFQSTGSPLIFEGFTSPISIYDISDASRGAEKPGQSCRQMNPSPVKPASATWRLSQAAS